MILRSKKFDYLEKKAADRFWSPRMLEQYHGTPKCLGTPRYFNLWSAPWKIGKILESGTPKYLGGVPALKLVMISGADYGMIQKVYAAILKIFIFWIFSGGQRLKFCHFGDFCQNLKFPTADTGQKIKIFKIAA